MFRILAAIIVVILGLVGLSFLASRGGHETYDARYFKPGPAIGMLKGLTDDALEGRKIGTDGSRLAQDMIIARMQALELMTLGGSDFRHGFEASYNAAELDDAEPADESTTDITVSGVNLIGAIQGTEGSDKVIVISAHYDHLGVVDGETYNGADDNASGVAAVLAVAQHFSQKKTPPKHSLIFAIFDGEEEGLLGAQAFVANPPLPIETIAFNLNLDMVARADNGKLWASGIFQNPALKPLIETVAKDTPLSLEMGFDGGNPDQDDWTSQSDQQAFLDVGIPHLYLGVEDHADYHQPSDTFENIDQDTFLKSVDTITAIAIALDDGLDDLLIRIAETEPATADE